MPGARRRRRARRGLAGSADAREAGGPDVEIRLFTGFHAPAATPRAIVDRLQREVARVVKIPEIRERLD